MIDGLICRLAGVTNYALLPPSPAEINNIKIERGLNTNPERQLEVVFLGNDILFDGKVKITLPRINAWSSIQEAAQKVKKLSIAAGIGFLVVGAWKSIPERSPLKALGTVIMTFAAAYFAWQAELMHKKADDNIRLREDLANWICSFRKDVMKNGLSHFSFSTTLLPVQLRARAIELLADSEIKGLFAEYIQVKSPEDLRVKINGLLELLKRLPETSSFSAKSEIFGTLQAYNDFKDKVSEIDFKSTNTYKYYQLFFKYFKDESENQSFLNLFNERLNKIVYSECESDKEQALNSVLSTQLSRICENPNRVYKGNKASLEYVDAVAELQFRRGFSQVFNQDDMNPDEYNNYIKWAQTQLNSLPPMQDRDVLISCLPSQIK